MVKVLKIGEKNQILGYRIKLRIIFWEREVLSILLVHFYREITSDYRPPKEGVFPSFVNCLPVCKK
jgi:hypothetical protein